MLNLLKSGGEQTNLKEYVDHMKGEHSIIGESIEAVSSSPVLGILRKKSLEVLRMVDSVEEFAVQQSKEFDGNKLESTMKDGFDLGDEHEKGKLKDKYEVDDNLELAMATPISQIQENLLKRSSPFCKDKFPNVLLSNASKFRQATARAVHVAQKTVEVLNEAADTPVVVQHRVPMTQKVRAEDAPQLQFMGEADKAKIDAKSSLENDSVAVRNIHTEEQLKFKFEAGDKDGRSKLQELKAETEPLMTLIKEVLSGKIGQVMSWEKFSERIAEQIADVSVPTGVVNFIPQEGVQNRNLEQIVASLVSRIQAEIVEVLRRVHQERAQQHMMTWRQVPASQVRSSDEVADILEAGLSKRQ